MSETATTIDQSEVQRIVLELTRARNEKLSAIEKGERDGKDRFYERGVAYGISLALNRLDGLQR